MKKMVFGIFIVFVVCAFTATAFSAKKKMNGTSDEKIKESVVKHLVWDDSVDASNIEVEVVEGKVRLRGSVATYQQRVNAAKDALDVAGVTALNDELLVKISMGPNDEDLTTRIYDTLKWQSDLNFDTKNIDVDVQSGMVTLNGNVDSYWKKFKAENLVSGLSGVKDVKNELAVVPTKNVSDERIASDVIEALERSAAVRSQKVTVEVKNGLVDLSGWVQDRDAYYAAQRVAIMTPGVLGLINDLVVY